MSKDEYLKISPILLMPRKTVDILGEDTALAKNIELRANELYEEAGGKYAGSERWDEMDRYWAAEHAAFEHEVSLAGHKYTYSIAAQKLVEKTLEILHRYGDTERTSLDGLEVVELGSGSGEWSLQMAKAGATVHVFDISWNALMYAALKAKHAGVKGQYHYHRGDMFDLPFEDEQFVSAYAGGVIEHFSPEKQDAYLQETSRVLRPGGTLGHTEPNLDSPLYLASKEKSRGFYAWLADIVPTSFLRKLPMDYDAEGSARDLGQMVSDNNFLSLQTDSLGICPSVPLRKSYVPDDPITQKFFEDLESLSEGPLFAPQNGTKSDDLLTATSTFWRRMESSFPQTEEGRKAKNDLAWWKYIIAMKN